MDYTSGVLTKINSSHTRNYSLEGAMKLKFTSLCSPLDGLSDSIITRLNISVSGRIPHSCLHKMRIISATHLEMIYVRT